MISRNRFNLLVGASVVLMIAIAAFVLLNAPHKDGAISWTAPMIARGWMAWTFATATFFYLIGAVLIAFTLIGIRYPETPRVGILQIATTRGDRLFISLLGSAFINILWLGLVGSHQPYALVVCLVFSLGVFRWV